MLASMMQPCIFLQLLALHQFHKYRAGHSSQQLNTAQTGTEHPALANVNTEQTKWKHSLWAVNMAGQSEWQLGHKGRNGTAGVKLQQFLSPREKTGQSQGKSLIQ